MRVPLLTVILAACVTGDPTADDTETDADTEVETDAETDTDPDTDVETDTDPDTDAETDTDPDTDAETDTDVETDTDAETDPETDTDRETDTDTDTDTDGAALPLADLSVDDLEIVEFLNDPYACDDPSGEYVELVHRGSAPVDLLGLRLVTQAATAEVTASFVAWPGERVLLVRDVQGADCYGLTGASYVDADLGDFVGDVLSIRDGADRVFDTIDYRWFLPLTGQSWEKDADGTWCPASTPIGASGDLGSPGLPNGACPGEDTGGIVIPTVGIDDLGPGDLLVTEVLADADACPEEFGEYVELLNTTDDRVDLRGAILSNNRIFFPVDTSVFVEPGARVVLARTLGGYRTCYGDLADLGTGMGLLDGGDRVRLARSDYVTVIDEVDFQAWATQPGIAWERDDDDPGAWCLADAVMAGGDLGSPGQPNGSCTPLDTDTDTDTDTDLPPDTDTDLPPDTDTDTDLPPDTDTDTDTDTPFVVDTSIDTPPSPLILSEIMDYGPDSSFKFVEVTNTGVDPAPLAGWAVVRYANGGTTPLVSPLSTTTTLPAGASWVIARPVPTPDWLATFGKTPNEESTGITGNGDDAYTLEYQGTIVDVYGEIGVLGVGRPWEYTDACATRLPTAKAARRIWRETEWTIHDCATVTIGWHVLAP